MGRALIRAGALIKANTVLQLSVSLGQSPITQTTTLRAQINNIPGSHLPIERIILLPDDHDDISFTSPNISSVHFF